MKKIFSGLALIFLPGISFTSSAGTTVKGVKNLTKTNDGDYVAGCNTSSNTCGEVWSSGNHVYFSYKGETNIYILLNVIPTGNDLEDEAKAEDLLNQGTSVKEVCEDCN